MLRSLFGLLSFFPIHVIWDTIISIYSNTDSRGSLNWWNGELCDLQTQTIKGEIHRIAQLQQEMSHILVTYDLMDLKLVEYRIFIVCSLTYVL